MTSIKICSLNVKGISTFGKRKEMFYWLKEKRFQIYFLQEVHCTTDQADQWVCEWGYKAIFSGNSSNSTGVGILFNNNFNLEVTKYLADANGRFIIADIKVNNESYTIANIYGPNEDGPIFFKQIGDYLIDFVCKNIIAGGDLNLVQDVNLDKQGSRDLQTHKKAQQELDTIKLNLDLEDIWRDLNPDEKRLTWRRRNPTIQCRLDSFLISNGLYSKVANADITPGHKTDHSMITLGLTIQSNPKGPGL